jgi:hypothetical protein
MAKMVRAPQVQNLLLDVGWCPQLRILRAGLTIDERSFAVTRISLLPLVESLARDTKIAVMPHRLAALFSVVKNAKFTGDIPEFGLRHHDPPELTVSDFA